MFPSGNYKPIKGYEKYYLIYDDGRVWSIRSNKFLKPKVEWTGYLSVDLCVNKQKTRIKIHRLVAEAFIPNPNNLQYVNHKDKNKQNNKANNLEWCTIEYNVNYNENYSQEERIKRQGIIGKPILCIETNTIYKSASEASKQLNLSRSHLSNVLNGRKKTAGGYHWKYIRKENLKTRKELHHD